jgi:hypothetical protein
MINRYKYAVTAILAWALQASAAQGQINNVVDCSQYPVAGAQAHAEDYLSDCRSWAQSRGYGDAVMLPTATAESEVDLASKPLSCPKLKEGNVGYNCIGLDKATK